MTEFLTALGLMFVIEGASYALFPDAMKRLTAQMSRLPQTQLRMAGLTFAIMGFLLIMFIRGV